MTAKNNLDDTVTVYMLAKSPAGEVELVKGSVPRASNDEDLSVETADAARRLTSLGHSVYGSFLASCPAAQLVKLAECKQVF